MWPVDILSRPYYRYRPRQIALRLLRAVLPAATHQEVPLPWGPRIRINIREMLGTSIWETGVFDIAVSETIWRLLEPADAAVDVGANIGYMTSIMATRVGRAGRVLAFEPHPRVRESLRDNLALLAQRPDTAEVQLHPYALSSRAGVSRMVDGAGFAQNFGLAHLVDQAEEPGATAVETRRLDDLWGDEPIALLKVDVEGHEAEVLRGAERLLREGLVRTLVYEDHLGPSSPAHALLRERGYTLFSLGWASRGLVLGALDEAVSQPFEAPSFVATLAPEEIRRRLLRPGWELLGSPSA